MLEQGSLRAPAGQHNELVLKSYMHTATKKVGWQIQSFSFSPSVGIAQLEGRLHHLDAMHHTVSQYRGRREGKQLSQLPPPPPFLPQAPTQKSQGKWEQQKHNSCLSSHFLPSKEGYVFITSSPVQGILASAITEVINMIGAE